MPTIEANVKDAPGDAAAVFFCEFRRTKLYDLLAAAPLIAWYVFALSIQLPRLAHQIAKLAK